MPVESLADHALRACTKNIQRLFDIGECPYDLLRPALLKITSPEQLRHLELNCPQLVGRDGEIWLHLIQRDVPGWESKPHEPRDPKNWWKVYRKLKDEARNDMNQCAEKLKAAFANINDKKEQNLTQLKTRRELPRGPGPTTKQRNAHKYYTGQAGTGGTSANGAGGKWRPKITLMEKMRKEAAPSKHSLSMTEIKKQHSTVIKAPADFLERARQPPTIPQYSSPIRGPRVAAPPIALSRPSSAPARNDAALQEREARLRALTSGRTVPPGRPTPAKRKLSFSDSEDVQPKRGRTTASIDDLF